MKAALLISLLYFITACSHNGIRAPRTDETMDEYAQSVVESKGGYKPEGYKCPDDEELIYWANGYICTQLNDHKYRGSEDIAMWAELSVYILFFAVIF